MKPEFSDLRVRIGIDVGGTFTHAVALDTLQLRLLGEVRVPTTHSSPRGVAAGIVESLRRLLDRGGFSPAQVERVAHSTTQATNALLEGDVCPVGVLCVGQGWEGKRAGGETNLEPLELAPGRYLEFFHRYLEIDSNALDERACRAAMDELVSRGAAALVMASAFSVEDAGLERRLLEIAAGLEVPVTATHEVSGLHGLRLRTRTAAVNASLLPRMLETACNTDQAVRELGIQAPLVVMRSDGGAMDLESMKRRPLLTMLSGPAAGLAAALIWARISDGIFLEVGGTSTDVSCIKNGRPFYRPACIGSFRLYMETLDVRSLGVAGGSMVRLSEAGRVLQVGPRSAHIAGLSYASFSSPETESGSPEQVLRVSPSPGDPSDYLALGQVGAARRTLTPTCAARFLGQLAPEFETGLKQGEEVPWDASLSETFEETAAGLGRDPRELAQEILEVGSIPLAACVEELAEEYRLDRRRLHLVGGGGGAPVWIPEVAQRLRVTGSVAPRAAVISAIGAALALLQETVERTLLDPGPEDFRRIRCEAEERLLASGAAPESIEVRVEVDLQRGLLRAVAIGSHQLEEEKGFQSEETLLVDSRDLFEAGASDPVVLARTRCLRVLGATWRQPRFLGFFPRPRLSWRVLDGRGRVRLGASHGEVLSFPGSKLLEESRQAFERLTRYGDAGGVLPPAFLLAGPRSLDLSGLPNVEARLTLIEMETDRIDPEEDVVLLLNLERA